MDTLNSEELRIEIHEGLNVVENWNSANSFFMVKVMKYQQIKLKIKNFKY